MTAREVEQHKQSCNGHAGAHQLPPTSHASLAVYRPLAHFLRVCISCFGQVDVILPGSWTISPVLAAMKTHNSYWASEEVHAFVLLQLLAPWAQIEAEAMAAEARAEVRVQFGTQHELSYPLHIAPHHVILIPRDSIVFRFPVRNWTKHRCLEVGTLESGPGGEREGMSLIHPLRPSLLPKFDHESTLPHPDFCPFPTPVTFC